MKQLTNSQFQLIDNENGHVTGNTMMVCNHSLNPNIASYSGPNVVFGQVMVADGVHAVPGIRHGGSVICWQGEGDFQCGRR